MHLPEAAGLWPLAPGWWLLLGLMLLMLLMLLATVLWHRRARNKPADYRRLALRQLDTLEGQGLAAQPLAAALNRLLKQVSLSQQPAGAALTGRAWLAFLNRHSPRPLSDQCVQLLSQQAYSARPLLTDEQVAEAVAELRHWLQHHRWEPDRVDP